MFVVNLVVWFYTRLYLFPLQLIHSAFTDLEIFVPAGSDRVQSSLLDDGF
jgi:hypothetical protein